MTTTSAGGDDDLPDAAPVRLIDAAVGDADGAVPPDAPTAPTAFADSTGYGGSVMLAGEDPSNPFYAPLGTNGRTCATCHVMGNGWSITPASVAARFAISRGSDALFRLVDGAVSPNADVSTPAAMKAAYAMLLTKAVIRVGLAIPSGAEFTVASCDDPYGYASAAELSLFRRPLPSTNLRFETSLMWDGREPSLAHQAVDATLGHAQATAPPSDAQVAAIVSLESGIYTAQMTDDAAGDLASDGATGGPQQLAMQQLGNAGFSTYRAWQVAAGARGSIARGEVIFNTRPIDITGVAGLADQQGTCATCHDTSNVGDHGAVLYVDIGTSSSAMRTPDLPLYTLRQTSTGATVQTTDPGLALVTGKWVDIGKLKVPTLRALAMRPPYFHDGSAATLDAVVTFYQNRFDWQLTAQDHQDLVAFLAAL